MLVCCGVVLGLLGCRTSATHQRDSAVPPAMTALTADVRKALGDEWRVFRRGGDLLLERKDRPQIYNTVSADPHEAKRLAGLAEPERSKAIAERFRVPSSYFIVVREGPKLDQAEVERRLLANQSISAALVGLERAGTVHRLKATAESDARIRSIWAGAREIPGGSYRDRSIYVHVTNLRAADTAAFVHQDYDAAAHRIVGLLTPYRHVRFRRWGDGSDQDSRCAYNEVAALKPIACPW
jgi:hypothetical protein